MVLHFRVPTVQHHRFSSPSGDRLVPTPAMFVVALLQFSSPSGDGLVHLMMNRSSLSRVEFSSPLRDGVVRVTYGNTFRASNFRPRVGMGWFPVFLYAKLLSSLFSSPSGDGLVHGCVGCKNSKNIFSSPLGDGLVPRILTKLLNSYDFRPRVGMGWLGSNRSKMEQ